MSDHSGRAREILAGALEVAPGALPGDAAIGALEAWDSLAHMRLVLALEEAVGGELESLEILGIERLADIAAILERRAAAA